MIRAFDDFTGNVLDGGWELRNFGGRESRTFHVQNLSGLLHVLAYQGTLFGMDDDKAIPKLAGLRVSKAPAKKTDGGGDNGG